MVSLKKYIESHPAAALSTVIFATAGVVGGSSAWFYQQQSSLVEERHKTEIDHVESELSDQINDLKTRLVSIGRRVGGEDLYLDVASIPIDNSSLRTLPSEFKSYQNGYYYVSVPTFEIWEHLEKQSQLDYFEMVFGEEFTQMLAQYERLGNVLSERNMVMWRSPNSIDVELSSNPIGVEQLKFWPIIQVMTIDSGYIDRMSQAIGEIFDFEDERDYEEELETLLDMLESQTVIRDSEGAENGSASHSSDAASDLDNSEPRNQRDEFDQLVFADELTGIIDDDLAGFLLFDRIASGYQLAGTFGAKFRVLSVEKKGNVLYAQTETIFDSQETATSSGGKVFLGEETFFIGIGDGGLLVRVLVPSIEPRSDAYTWTQAWLTGLRVPLER